VDQHCFAWLGLGAQNERLVGGEIGRAQSGSLGECQPLVQGEDVVFFADHVFGVGASVAVSDEDALAHAEARASARRSVGQHRPAHGHYVATGIRAWRVGQIRQPRQEGQCEQMACSYWDVYLEYCPSLM